MSKNVRIPMTAYGASMLRVELSQLKKVERPKIIAAITEARAYGDLKENSEYHAARERQSFTESRINQIEFKLGNSHIINILELTNNGKVIFGATVKLINLDNEKKVTYQIVGDDEADLKEGKVSINSPVARTLIGKYVGDAVEVHAPSAVISYEIDAVEYI